MNILKRNGKAGKSLTPLAIIIIIIIIIIIGAVWFLVSMMNRSIRTSVYSERKELLGQLTESSANVVNDNLEYYQSITDMIADNAYHRIPDYETISDYIRDVKERPGFKDHVFFFVDSSGKYAASDGTFGKIIDTTYYTGSSEEKLSYISTLPHLNPDKAFLIIRNRFSCPISVGTEHGQSELLYCGVLFDIDMLNETITREFAGENNTFIYDDRSGVMLYKNFGIKMLIPGFNIYPKFSQAKLLFGDTAEELTEACRNLETVVAAMEIDGEEYYFCSAPVNTEGWSVSYILQSSYLDTVSGSSFGKIIVYIALIAAVLGTAVVLAVAMLYRNAVTAKSLETITGLNRELENATKAKSDFLSNMSHDIRTPINGIMGMTTIAKGVEGNPAKTMECLNKIDNASHHLLSLVNDVLDMSRIERGKTEISAKPIDIRMVVENCSSIVRGQMNGRDLELNCEINCMHPHVIGDDLHIRQILINILGNAVKFTGDGGRIWLRCTELEGEGDKVPYVFEVEDTGIGMKADYIPKIFDVFTQDEGGARSSYKGTGLGMAITKQLTELMGGRIEVESELDKGSRFTVTIPLEINTNGQVEEKKAVTAADIEGVKLLLAEDNELNMDIAMELLGDAGAVITPVENGAEALEAFTGAPPGTFDAILMDVMMPVMNGLDATRAIRSLPREDARTIPILAMTANAFESDIQATFEAGMNAHLVKPINIGEVIRSIAYYTNKQ